MIGGGGNSAKRRDGRVSEKTQPTHKAKIGAHMADCGTLQKSSEIGNVQRGQKISSELGRDR